MSVPEAVAAAIARQVRNYGLNMDRDCSEDVKIATRKSEVYVREKNNTADPCINKIMHKLVYAVPDQATAPTAIRISEALEHATILPLIERDNDAEH